jgi:hypothetical protein
VASLTAPLDVRVNGNRLMQRIFDLAEIGAIDGGGCARLALTDADKLGRDLVIEWMKDLDTIFIKFFNSNNIQIESTFELSVNSDNCYYLMKNAAYSYNFKSYRDALIDGDSAQNAISFEQYENDKNESKKFIRVLNKIDAETISQQYFQILEDG